jgi:alpha-N-arabinofuranosidase
MPIKWSDDGFPYMTQGNDLIPMIVKKANVAISPKATFGNFTYNDNFDSPTLGLEWMTLRSSATDTYSLTEKPGYLSLKCSDINASERKTPSFVCRRLQHHKFECSTKLDYQPESENEFAGLLLYKDESHQYFLAVSKSSSERKISLIKITGSSIDILAEKSINNSESINLKVISKGTHYNFYYTNGKDKWASLCENIDAHYLSTANSFGFTGTTIGLYATKKLLPPQ